MECYIPADCTIDNSDYDSLKRSHENRQFIIFDEQFKLILYSNNQERLKLVSFNVWINESLMLECTKMDRLFDIIDNGTKQTWIMKPNVCADDLFRSTVVMNNAYDNHIKFIFKYQNVNATTIEQIHTDDKDTDNTVYLESFEPIYMWSKQEDNKETAAQSTKTNESEENSTAGSSTEEEEVESIETLCLEFPIYSLLNMRLRNTSLDSKQHIISSLDFQTSKAATQLANKYSQSPNTNKMEFQFDEVLYELVDRNSHIRLNPIIPLEIPFKAFTHDSFSICYKLPLLSNQGPYNATPHRVRIKLIYNIILSYDTTDSPSSSQQVTLPVLTSWETDVTIKKPTDYSVLSRVASTSVLSTPKLISNSKRFPSLATHLNYSNANISMNSNLNNSNWIQQQNSMTSLVNNKTDTVKFKFLNNNLQVSKGEKFHMRLQIVNCSNAPLDLVVYYNNNKNSSLALGAIGNNSTFATLPPTKQYQIYRKFSKVTEGIILLSNDYKVPMIQPKETYFVDLSFIAVMSGYYSTLSALKVLDLHTNELIEVGLSASILVK